MAALAFAACTDRSPIEEAEATGPALWPPALASHTMVYHDSLEQVLLFGGSRADRSFSDTLWAWDGDRWQALGNEGPGARIHAGLAFDRYRNRLVVFGGIDAQGQTLGDLWEWDGAGWEERLQSEPRPGPRDHHAMVYSPSRGGVVLFGGQDEGDGYPNDTWMWEDGSWRVLDVSAPPGRATHRLASDPRLGAIILVGGWGPEEQLSDVWELRRREWVRIEQPGFGDPGPSARGAHRVAFDEARAELVLFGGLGGPDLLGDTWTRTELPVGWKPRDVPGPPARNVHGMAYDRRRERVVLYGGIGVEGRVDDLWEWDGSEWRATPTFGRPLTPPYSRVPLRRDA